MTRRLLRRGLIAAVGIGAVAAASTAAAAPDPTYPNLPAVPISDQLEGAFTDTIGYVPPSRQWIRVPEVTLATDIETLVNYGVADTNCAKKYGAAMCTPAPDTLDRLVVHARAYPVTVKTPVTDSRFADFPATIVRMVAFGSIPVQATVHLSLPLGDDGLPQGIVAAGATDEYDLTKGPGADPTASPGQRVYDVIGDSTVTGALQVRVSDLTVDGVPVEVGNACRTATPAPLSGSGLGFISKPTDTGIPAGRYNPRAGGTITGTLDVPRFTGCGTGGDDLDAVVSAMASGKGFPVTIEQGELGACWATPPSMINSASCGEPTPPSFPTRKSR